MHNTAADRAYDDVVSDGSVTINGRAYSVDTRIVTALRNQRAFFRAGVVGPDGLPDVVYGQTVVHPGKTGDWNRFVVERAWAAQSDPAYSPVQREQILAFAYGYISHAAGDMWAHTFVNDFAGGVFPPFADVLSNAGNAGIALRHLIGELYIGDTAPGFDANKDRQPVPMEVNEDGDPDISDTSTPRQDFAAPSKFVYETFVNPRNRLPFGVCGDNVDDDGDGVRDDGCPGEAFTVGDPEPRRGRLIDFFLNLEAKLQVAESRFEFDSEFTDCSTLGGLDDTCQSRIRNVRADTVRGNTSTSMEIWVCTDSPCVVSGTDVAADLINGLIDDYLEAWIDDIEAGLRDWTEIGLATMQAMQDPQARRDAQNFICRNKGAEDSALRAACEDGVGMVDVMLFKTESYIEEHLLSMLGLPDVVGDVIDAVDVVGEFLADIIPFNPISAGIAELKEIARGLVKDAIEESLGLNLDHLKSLITSPTYWLEVQNVSVQLPVLGTVGVDLFRPGTHELLDQRMGLAPNHHVFQELFVYGEPLPVQGTGLADDAVFDPEAFKAFKNSATQSKLLLLGSTQLNALLKAELVASGVVKPSANISTYTGGLAQTNVMWTPLRSSLTWLRTIDGDHAWRVDGRPRFCNEGSGGDCVRTEPELPPTPRPAEDNAGLGVYPLWESCQNRPAFRSLFADWENGTQNFPDLGDPTSFDPSDAAVPTGTIGLSGNTITANGTTYVGGRHTFTVSASDATFTDGQLTLSYRYYRSGTTPGAFVPIANGGTFAIPASAGDGRWTVELRSGDPCHTFAPGSTNPGSVTTREVVLDTTPPTITITSPAPQNVIFDTDDFSSIAWTVVDTGSGVKASTIAATFDGAVATSGQVLDMFFLNPGQHSVVVSAADNLGNTGSLTRLFRVNATSASLVNNVDRACTLGLIQRYLCLGVRVTIDLARAAHAAPNHSREHILLNAWAQQVDQMPATAIDPATALRFSAHARDLIARGG